MPSNILILCHALLLPSIFPSIRALSNEWLLHISWPKYWRFSFSISPSNEYSGLISWILTIMVIWVIKTCIALLCILVTYSNLFYFYQVFTISLLYFAHLCMKCSLNISNFLEEISSLFQISCFLLFLYIVHLRKPSYLFLLFSRTLNSFGYVFLFLPCLSLLFFLELFVEPLQTTTLPSYIFFPLWDSFVTASSTMLWTSVHTSSGTLSTRPYPLDLFFNCTV